VIDWGQVVWGPLLYDVASAVVFQRLGGHDGRLDAFLDAYGRGGAGGRGRAGRP